MSNYLSQPIKYAPTTSNVNLPLINTVLASKQGKYDAAKEQIQQTLDAFGNIQVLRDQDKEYIAGKLDGITSQINGFGNRDLSQSGVSDKFMSKIKSAARDPFIVSALEESYKMKKYTEQAEAYKKEGKGGYNDLNYQYGLSQAGYGDYMEGKSNKMGSLAYTEYTDVNGELKEIAENLSKFAEVVKVSTPNGMYYETLEGKRLSKERIRNIAEAQLTDNAKRQMGINAWGNFEAKMTPEDISKSFSKYKDGKLESIDGIISQLEVSKKNAHNEDEKGKFDASIKQYKEYRRQEEEVYNSYIDGNSTKKMAFTLEKETLLNNFANAYSPGFSVSKSYSTNTAYFETLKIEARATAAALKTTTTEDGLPKIEGTHIATDLNPVKVYEETYQKAQDFEKAFQGEIGKIFSGLDEQGQQAAESYLREHNIPKENRSEALYEYFSELAGENSTVISIGDIENAGMLKHTANTNLEKYTDSTNRAYENLEKEGLRKLYDTSSSKDKIKIINEQGNTVYVRDYLESKGINSYEDFTNNKEVQDKMYQQYYADMHLSRPKLDKGKLLGAWAGSLIPGGDSSKPIRLTRGPESIYRNRLIKTMGSEAKADEFLEKVRKAGAYDTNPVADSISASPGGLMVAPFLEMFNRDNSYSDDQGTNSLVTESNIKSEASKIISETYIGTSNKGIRVNPKSEEHTRIGNLVGDIGIVNKSDNSTYFQINKETPFTMRMLTPTTVEIAQVVKGTEKTGPYPHKAVIDLVNIPQDIISKINFGANDKTYTSENFPALESRVKYGDSNNIKRVKDLRNNVFAGNEALAYQTTKEETLGGMFRNYSNLLGSYNEPTEAGIIYKNIIESNDIILKAEKNDGEIYPTLFYSKEGREIMLHTPKQPIPHQVLDEQYKVMKYAPQLFVNKFLKDILIKSSITGGYNSEYEQLKKLYGTNRQQ